GNPVRLHKPATFPAPPAFHPGVPMSTLPLKFGFALLGLLASAASLAQDAPAAMVEVATADLVPMAPQRWVPASVVSRDDARLATGASGRLEFVAEVGTRLKA